MRIVAFITDGPSVRDILDPLGEPTTPPRIATARGPPLWAASDAEHDPAADPLLQSTPSSSSTSASAGRKNRRRSPVRDAGRARSCPRPPARARPEVPRQACGAAPCRRKSTLDPPYRLLRTQPRALGMTIRWPDKSGQIPCECVTDSTAATSALMASTSAARQSRGSRRLRDCEAGTNGTIMLSGADAMRGRGASDLSPALSATGLKDT